MPSFKAAKSGSEDAASAFVFAFWFAWGEVDVSEQPTKQQAPHPVVADPPAGGGRARTNAMAASTSGSLAWAGVLPALQAGKSDFVPEAIAVRHMGSRVLAISLVTNLAAGISATPLSHAEVQETAAAARSRFSGLIVERSATIK